MLLDHPMQRSAPASPEAVTPARSVTTAAGPAPSNASNASTSMTGGVVAFANDTYTITMGDNDDVLVHNRTTDETYHVWGDPHVEIDGAHAFDFHGTTTLALDDGTKVTIDTVPLGPGRGGLAGSTVASTVTITNGDYGVQVTGIDANTAGDLAFTEYRGQGTGLDDATADGNLLAENENGAGFLGRGNQAVDQRYIDATDLQRPGVRTDAPRVATSDNEGDLRTFMRRLSESMAASDAEVADAQRRLLDGLAKEAAAAAERSREEHLRLRLRKDAMADTAVSRQAPVSSVQSGTVAPD